MNKKELISKVAELSKVSIPESKDIIETMIEIIKDSVIGGNSIEIRGFGKFHQKKRKATNARLVKENKFIHIPEMWLPKFTPYSEFKDKIKRNGK